MNKVLKWLGKRFEWTLVILLTLSVVAIAGLTNFDRIELDESSSSGDIIFANGEYIHNNTNGILNFGAAASIGDSLKVGSGKWVKKIGLTTNAGSMFVVIYAEQANKDTAWLPLN